MRSIVAMIKALLVALVLSVQPHAAAQAFPTKPVKLIVPWSAGGPTDLLLRALADATQKHLGQPVVIENRPGASGLLGPSYMVSSTKPDGYTLSQLAITVFRLPQMMPTSIDPAKDFTYVINVAGGATYGIVVRNDAPWKSFAELVAFAKANPGKIRYATSGVGTTQHITMEQIAKREGIKWIHVPLKGSAETNAALLGGHVEVVADSSGWAPLVEGKELRLLVTWGAERAKRYPDVPTLRESGVDMVSYSPMGLAGPRGMDPAVVKVLHDAFRKGMDDPAFVAAMARFDQMPLYMDSKRYADYATELIAEEKRVVQEFGLKQP